MASRHPISRVNKNSLVQHKPYAILITTPRERHTKYDVKPPVAVHAHSRPSSAIIRSAIEKCDILQQDLENNKQFIAHLSVDVIQTNEEYKKLYAEFGKIENWHRINDIHRQLTELERKLTRYGIENGKIKENNNELKRSLKKLDGRCVVIVKKQKVIKEQSKTPPKNLMKRAKIQGVTMSPPLQLRTTDLELNKSVESVRAEKSDIQSQFNQYQSELDNLINTERRLKENIYGLQASHNTMKHEIHKLKEKEKTARSSRKHKKEVQKTATKPVYHNNLQHTLQSSRSSTNLEVLKNEARACTQQQVNKANQETRLQQHKDELQQLSKEKESLDKRGMAHQEREVYRGNLEIKLQHQVELQQLSKEKESLEKRILDLQNQLNDAIKRNGKFHEQLVQTEQQVEAKWIDHVKEKDKRIAELEKSISDVNSEAINHQRLLQYENHIKQLKLNLNKESTELLTAKDDFKLKEADLIRQVDKLKHQVEELKNNHKELEKAVKEKDLEVIKTKRSFKEKDLELTQSLKEKDLELAKTKESLKEKDLELTKTKESLKEKDLELAKTKESLKEKDLELTKAKESLKEKDLELAKTKESLDLELTKTKESLKEKHLELAKTNESLKEKDSELTKTKESLKEKDLELTKTKESLKEKDLELAKTKKSSKESDLELAKTRETLRDNYLELAKTKRGSKEKRGLTKIKEDLKEKDLELTKTKESLKEKDLELTKTKELLQTAIAQKNEELKVLQRSLLKYEEKSFKFTNAFTSAGEGSVLDMSKRYRHLQHNKRAAAARALKKAHKIEARDHLCNQIMNAYETAKLVVLDEARRCIDNNLFELQTDEGMISRNKELLQGCMVLLSCIQENEKIKNTAINQIKITLDQAYKELMDDNPLPSEVEDYYQSLAELAWCAVARPIPMIIAKSPDTYHKCYHELKDDEDVEDGSAVSYVYPVLYSSNECPRQVAQEGRVVLKQHL